ncbi:MAG: excinuclease ABC subunit UvrC [Candidatus Sumerlaeia bacterium]
MGMTDDLEQRIKPLPHRPGVYLFKDAQGRIIYIGKAKDLASRVASYFTASGEAPRPLVPYLRAALADLDVIVTDTESEAFLLENTLIKRHRPRFNIRLRDDKDFYSIRIDPARRYPRLEWIRARNARPGDGAMYFGPYSSSRAVKDTIRLLQKLFPLRSCSDRMMRNRTRPCLLHPLGRCCAPCVLPVSEDDYAALVRNTVLFLEGRKQDVVRLLRDRMSEASERMDFERAAVFRDQIRMIERALDEEKVVKHRPVDRDVVAHAIRDGQAEMAVLCYRAGSLTEVRHFDLGWRGESPGELYYSFFQQYYGAPARVPPPEIVTLEEPDDAPLIEEYLCGLRRDGRRVRLNVPRRGEKRRLALMAAENAGQHLRQRLSGKTDVRDVLGELRHRLGLPVSPETIECIDVSNIGGALTVASVVVFREGEPVKGEYRRYKILREGPADDYGSMREVLRRRYARALAEGRAVCDLLIVDGGKGQLNMACEIFRELGLSGVGLAALAKEHAAGGSARRHAGARDRVFIPGRKNPVGLEHWSPAMQLLRRVRDEAHRFALAYHHTLRRKANLKSILDEIPGVGPGKRRALLRRFGSVARIRAASPDELAALPGITPALAETIHRILTMRLSDDVGLNAAGGGGSERGDGLPDSSAGLDHAAR